MHPFQDHAVGVLHGDPVLAAHDGDVGDARAVGSDDDLSDDEGSRRSPDGDPSVHVEAWMHSRCEHDRCPRGYGTGPHRLPRVHDDGGGGAGGSSGDRARQHERRGEGAGASHFVDPARIPWTK